MFHENEINTATNTTTPLETTDPGAKPSPSADSVAAGDCDPKPDTQPDTPFDSTPSPTGTPQDADQLPRPPYSEIAGPNQDPASSGTSPLRAETARHNGSKSHGPATEEGKKRSRMNALKHGLRSETLLLETSSDEENAAFRALRTRLEEQFPPRTLEEQLLLESMVHALWQKKRCLQFETNELRASFIFHGPVMDRILRYATSADKRLFRALSELKHLQNEDASQTSEDDTADNAEGD
ncbi:MAG TPA: hypothetical protein VMR80_10705 [Candidatus Acidoferrum sp.]|nr:hypothetical protein [Candidatus Acidoferrum sp.]